MGKFIDISGKKFGKWTAVEYLGKGAWKCRCDCGSYGTVFTYALRNGVSKSCGCIKSPDLSGERFGSLVVEHKVVGGGWQCLCDCGKRVVIQKVAELKNGNRKRCGRDCSCSYGNHAMDLTGKNFGRLHVIKRIKKDHNPNTGYKTEWLCKCDCGKEIVANGRFLREGSIVSCGCNRKNGRTNYKMMTGLDLPDDKRIVFLDGNSENCSKNNMVVVSNYTYKMLSREGWFNLKNELKLEAIKACELSEFKYELEKAIDDLV